MKYLRPTLLIMLLPLCSRCLRELPLNQSYGGLTPEDMHDGWPISTPAAQGFDEAALDGVFRWVHENDSFWPLRSFSVYRNGALVAETYLKSDGDRTEKRAIWSCTKQVLALITGCAFGQGLIDSLDIPVAALLREYTDKHPDKADITLRQLLSMKGGIGFDNSADDPDVFRRRQVDNSLEFLFGRDLRSTPGTEFNYNDGEPQIVSAILQQVTGTLTSAYGKQVLFDPLGIRHLDWITYPDGITMGAFGILTTPRDLARFGQCVMDSGRWQGVQVVPEDWITRMLTPQEDSAYGFSFGLYWWMDSDRGYQWMWGHGGQYVILVPAHNILVVLTSLEQVEDGFAVPVEDALDIADRVVGTLY